LKKTQGRIVLISSGAAVGAYAAWSAYGTSKAAINHLCKHLAVEEPDIISVAISPGKVDTDMQKQIRELGGASMSAKEHAGFVEKHATGQLLKPEQPGAVIANLIVGATPDMNGKHFRYVTGKDNTKSTNTNLARWNDPEMSGFQGA
jgi:NAD(P)-dependent dehydrogenase (short-subunit alcohol dehydrogenase family)